MNGRKPIPGLLSILGVSVPLVAELFAAAADYYRLAPWRWMENWIPIEVRYPPEGRPRYALVLGGGGEIFGLSLYESLADLDVVFERTEPDQPFSRPIGWFSLVLDEATGMSFADLDAMEQYHWPVAGEKAYPMVLKATPKNDWGELPSASELAWLAAALRVIRTLYPAPSCRKWNAETRPSNLRAAWRTRRTTADAALSRPGNLASKSGG